MKIIKFIIKSIILVWLLASFVIIVILKPKEEEMEIDKSTLISEELSLQGEIIVNRGIMTYKNDIISDSWLPFDKKTLEVRLQYEFITTYKLNNISVKKFNDEYIIVLPIQFETLTPILIDEEFRVKSEIFSGKFDESVYQDILEMARESIEQKILVLDTFNYKLSVEKNLDNILKKFEITNIHYLWE